MSERGRRKSGGFLKKMFGPPRDEDDYDTDEIEGTGRSSYDTIYGHTANSDKVRPLEDDVVVRREEASVRQTNIKTDVSAYSSNGIEMELMRPKFTFDNGISLESISDVSREIIEALKENKTVLLDLYDLGDDERTVITYVVLGAVNALGYTITNVRDHLMFTLTPEGISVAQDERVRYDGEEGLRYSNDYR